MTEEIRKTKPKVTPAQRKWTRILHVAKRECGLDDEAYRALLEGAAGVDSARDIRTWRQFSDALAAFKALGFRVKSQVGCASGLKETDAEARRNPEWMTARQERYIRGLWGLASRKKDAESLRAMIKRVAGVDDVSWLRKQDAQKVILALRDMAEKAGRNSGAPEG